MSKLNNKFGDCCNCPSLSNDDRIFNNYTSNRIFNDTSRRSLRLADSHDYRDYLQNNGLKFMKSKVYDIENLKCKNDKKNNFYFDSSDYTFDKPLQNQYLGPKCINNNINNLYSGLENRQNCRKFKFEKSKVSDF